jgi:hypothetical protein
VRGPQQEVKAARGEQGLAASGRWPDAAVRRLRVRSSAAKR